MKKQEALLLRPNARLHPLLAAAAVAVIALCAVGVAALTGLLPSPSARGGPPQEALSAEAEGLPAGGEPPAEAPTLSAAQPSPAAPAPVAAVPPAAAPQPAPAPAPARAVCAECGTVETIREVRVPVDDRGNAILGTVAGGVVGGVVGNQFGGGSGKTALTVLGAVGGALAGHEIERNIRGQRTVTRYEMTVRMEDGSARKFYSEAPFMLASGDHVRVDNGRVLPR